MCGICGILRHEKPVLSEEIERMKDVLKHRGPDDEGLYLTKVERPDKTTYLGLGHRRLSIIDLSANARQPMSNEDGQIWLTYNGEIYNFAELRSELEHCGHTFKSRSDSEVIIHAYEQWDTDCLERFNGMFAFAIWDANQSRIFLARDRLGIKPLYYCCRENLLVFASELKALLQINDVPRNLDYQSVSDYLSWQFVPAPSTIFRDICKLPPAHLAVFENRTLTCRRYWNVRDYTGRLEGQDIKSVQKQIQFILRDSVEKRMISDVSLGAFLSGGFDSSTIVALMSDIGDEPVRTFSIGFESEEYASELRYAQMTAKAFKSDHHERILSSDKLVKMLDRLVWHMDEPFADHSMVPTFLVSQAAREHVTVALSGDGADENFAGYPGRYRFAYRYSRYLRWPQLVRNVFEAVCLKTVNGLLLALPESTRRKKLLKLKDVFQSSDLMRIVNLSSVVDNNLKKRMLSEFVREQVRISPMAESIKSDVCSRSLLEEVLLMDVENYLVDDILTKVDRMSMANSLEVRVPFLDHRLVELAASVSTEVRMHDNTPKYLLKTAFKDMLPEFVLNRRKQGFGIPLKFWMQNDIANYTSEVLLDGRFRKRYILESKQVERMIKATAAGECNYSRELWAILVFELWCRRFMDDMNN